MCGIAGVLGSGLESVTDTAMRLAERLAHRGPDDSGLWHQRLASARGDLALALGHRRLSIIDPSPAGRQPMVSRDGLAVACTNGEFYNYRELRAELESAGVTFSTQSDTEVLVEGYRFWGLEVLHRLHGMFAFALWDAAAECLYLVRDRLGIKPLYFARLGGGFAFSSELHALREMSDFPAEIDRESLAHFLAYGYVAGPRTIYKAAKRLMPGEYLTWKSGETTINTYWPLPADLAADPRSLGGPTTVADHLENLLRQSIAERLVADVPIGAFLSGGIDSSSVVSLMADLSPFPVKTFTVGFDQTDFDESDIAAAVAGHLGTDHHELRVSRTQAVEAARELPRLFDEPFADASALPTLLVSRFARTEVKVVLSGDGGDELFGGYSRYRRIAQFERAASLPGWIRSPLSRAARVMVATPRRHRVGLMGVATTADFAEQITARFDDHLLARCAKSSAKPARATFRRYFHEAELKGAARGAMIADTATYLVDDILTKLDRTSMSTGLEARVPLLDHRLVTFALSLPLGALWRRGASKAPLRDVAARRLPSRLLERPKSGFGFPVSTLLDEELDRWTSHYLRPARLRDEGLLDPAAVQAMTRATDRSSRLGLRGLWHLICFERWFAVRERHEPLN